MDCGSSADGKEGTAFYELERGQLYAEPQVRPIYCHVTPPLGQLSLASLRGRLIEYQLRLGVRAGMSPLPGGR